MVYAVGRETPRICWMSLADKTAGIGSTVVSGRAAMSDGAMVNRVLSGFRLAGKPAAEVAAVTRPVG
jgi:hypothetical protein